MEVGGRLDRRRLREHPVFSARGNLWPDEPTPPLLLFRACEYREGSSRESKRDYLHFLYISRGSLSETQYFIHLSRRLGYLSPEVADNLNVQTKQVFACLHGLIKAVEKESGKFAKVTVAITTFFSLV